MNTYDVIKSLCDEKGIAVTALEKELGFGRGSIGKIKNGGSMSVKRLQQIADYFDVNLQYFADRTEPVRYQTLSLFSSPQAQDALYGMLTRALKENFTGDEFILIGKYRNLNDEGKSKLSTYLSDLLDMPKYKNTPQPPNDD